MDNHSGTKYRTSPIKLLNIKASVEVYGKSNKFFPFNQLIEFTYCRVLNPKMWLPLNHEIIQIIIIDNRKQIIQKSLALSFAVVGSTQC